MKLLLRLSILCSLFAILTFGFVLSPAQTAFAQANKCAGLNAADCTLLKSAFAPAQLKQLTSFNMDYEITLVSSGIKGNDVNFKVTGNGAFEFDKAGGGVGALTPASSLTALNKLNLLTLQTTMAATLTSNGQTNSGNLEIRIVNGTLYYQGDKLTNGEWRTADLQQALKLRGARGTANSVVGKVNPLQLLSMLGALDKLLNTPGFITAERAADTTVEKQQMANFIVHANIPTLLTSPGLLPFIKAANQVSGRPSTMTDAQITAMEPTLATAFKDTTFSITSIVGQTDKLTHGLGIDVVLKLDPATFAGMAGGLAATPDPNAQPINFNFHFLVNLTGIGSKVNVTAPANAKPVDLGTPEPTPEATQAQ